MDDQAHNKHLDACTPMDYDFESMHQRSHMNLGTFSNTVMDSKAIELYTQFCGINAVDFCAYPELTDIQTHCQKFLLSLTHGHEDEHGALSTSGSSEAIILSLFFMKQAWSLTSKHLVPNIILPENSHIAWHKAASLLEVEVRLIPTSGDKLAYQGEDLEHLVNEHTLGVVCTMGTTNTLSFDDVSAVNAKLKGLYKKTGLYIPIHVDAASGGFVAPFYFPKLKWDFKLEHVSFINISSHKYGLVYPALAWLLFKENYCTRALSHENVYLGHTMKRTQLQFSHSAGPLVAQHYYIQNLGFKGYQDIFKKLYKRRETLIETLNQGYDIIQSKDKLGLPAVIFSKDSLETLRGNLLKQGWHLPTYHISYQNQSLRVGRIVLRHGMSDDMFAQLLCDIELSSQV